MSADGGRIESTVEYSDDLRPFFDASPFFVEYDVDVSAVPESIRSIPVLAHVCPVAWAFDADVYVPVADARFLRSLLSVGRTLSEMYPFVDGGRVFAGEAPEWPAQIAPDRETGGSEVGEPILTEADGAGMLFTGGVDSLATYVRHREEEPTLITVRGWVIDVDATEDERWHRMRARTESFANRFGVDARFVRSNMLEFLNTTMLGVGCYDRHDGSWYTAVGCGLGMLGLCAPLAVADGLGQIYVAASVWEEMEPPPVVDYWEGRAMPWGTHPDIDSAVAWADSQGVHDAFELDRQGRIGVIGDYVREHDPTLPVYSCSTSMSAENCGRCEKCIRTALGLALAGLDPADHGIEGDRSSFEHAIREFERGACWSLSHAPYHWRTFQSRIPADAELPMDGADEFVDWLHEADFESMGGRSMGGRLLRTVIRRAPYGLYAAVQPRYSAVKRRLKRDGRWG